MIFFGRYDEGKIRDKQNVSVSKNEEVTLNLPEFVEDIAQPANEVLSFPVSPTLVTQVQLVTPGTNASLLAVEQLTLSLPEFVEGQPDPISETLSQPVTPSLVTSVQIVLPDTKTQLSQTVSVSLTLEEFTGTVPDPINVSLTQNVTPQLDTTVNITIPAVSTQLSQIVPIGLSLDEFTEPVPDPINVTLSQPITPTLNTSVQIDNNIPTLTINLFSAFLKFGSDLDIDADWSGGEAPYFVSITNLNGGGIDSFSTSSTSIDKTYSNHGVSSGDTVQISISSNDGQSVTDTQTA